MSDTLARFCRALCATSTTMPDHLRESLTELSRSRAASPETEREQAKLLATEVLRAFAAEALYGIGLVHEAMECEAAASDPESAALAARRSEFDIHVMTAETDKTDFHAVAQIVALSASQAWFTASDGVDALVPLTGDLAALSILAWEMPVEPRPMENILDWLWQDTAEVVEACVRAVEGSIHR